MEQPVTKLSEYITVRKDSLELNDIVLESTDLRLEGFSIQLNEEEFKALIKYVNKHKPFERVKSPTDFLISNSPKQAPLSWGNVYTWMKAYAEYYHNYQTRNK